MRFYARFPVSATATPPRIAIDASSRRKLSSSPSNITPPSAAITGTVNWTAAALVTVKPRSAVYQITYPRPEVTPPDSTAYQTPALSSDTDGNIRMPSTTANGTARTKLPAMTSTGSPVPLPRMEKNPQAMPDATMSSAPTSGGAVSPGSTRPTMPANAHKNPAARREDNFSP